MQQFVAGIRLSAQMGRDSLIRRDIAVIFSTMQTLQLISV